MKYGFIAAALAFAASPVLAADHAMAPGVMAEDQSAENGIVSADSIMAPSNGWMVVHRTGADMKPGPVVGYAPLRKGENTDVAAILTEPVAAGDMLMLMVHSEEGGMTMGGFEYTLGAKEDGPIRVDGNLVMKTITVK